MQFKYILIISLISINYPVFTQYANLYDARSLGLSGVTVTSSYIWSGIHNPAGLGLNSSFEVALNYNNRFLIPELNTRSIVASIPTELGNISPMFSYFGDKYYNESQLMFAYGKMLCSWLSVGISMSYHLQRIQAVSRKNTAVTGQIGLIAIPTKGLMIGVNILNPTQSSYGYQDGEYLPSGLRAGISLSREKGYFLAAQINYSEFRDLIYSMGAECIIAKKLSILAGVKFPSAISYSLGIGVEFQPFIIDLGFEQHSILGLSSAITISYLFRKPNEKTRI